MELFRQEIDVVLAGRGFISLPQQITLRQHLVREHAETLEKERLELLHRLQCDVEITPRVNKDVSDTTDTMATKVTVGNEHTCTRTNRERKRNH